MFGESTAGDSTLSPSIQTRVGLMHWDARMLEQVLHLRLSDLQVVHSNCDIYAADMAYCGALQPFLACILFWPSDVISILRSRNGFKSNSIMQIGPLPWYMATRQSSPFQCIFHLIQQAPIQSVRVPLIDIALYLRSNLAAAPPRLSLGAGSATSRNSAPPWSKLPLQALQRL